MKRLAISAFSMMLVVGVSWSLICFEKHFDWRGFHSDPKNPKTVQCNGRCRFLSDKRVGFPFWAVQQDCIERSDTSNEVEWETGCRNETKSKSAVCFCEKDYCNSPQNISKDFMITKTLFPDVTCYSSNDLMNPQDRETSMGPYCFAWSRKSVATGETEFTKGDRFSQALYHKDNQLFTKWEVMFQHYPYGAQSGFACVSMDRVVLGKRKKDTYCICQTANCNLPRILSAPKASKTVRCYVGSGKEASSTKDVCMAGEKCTCWGEYCFTHYVKPLGENVGGVVSYKETGCLNSTILQGVGVTETLDYYRKICKQDFCNDDIVSGASKTILSVGFILANAFGLVFACVGF